MKAAGHAALFIIMTSATGLLSQPRATSDAWRSFDPGFRPLAITSHSGKLWVCGVGEGIASSEDGEHWTSKHPKSLDGGILLGIDFASGRFGYAYGTSGTLLTTEDDGETWVSQRAGEESILLASFSANDHGLIRTRDKLSYFDGSGASHPVDPKSDVLQRFPFTPGLVALSESKMGIFASEGQYSEGGFLTTQDGGKTWVFFDPPGTGVKSFLRVDGRYWASGHEVMQGLGQPSAKVSDDGVHWDPTTNDIKACHWEICGLCTSSGCLASGSLLVDFFHGPTIYATVPKGALTAKWAANSEKICTIRQGLFCANLGKAVDPMAQPIEPAPSEQTIGKLGLPPAAPGILQCLFCALEPVYVDHKIQGRYKVHLRLTVRQDGTVDSASLDGAPNDTLQQKVHSQIIEWLFEPPRKDGRSIQATTDVDLGINVVRSP